jgi:two-component system response regulator BaeR
VTPTSAAHRILVVEDDPAIAGLLVDYLRAAGHAPSACGDGLEAVQRFIHEGPWAAVLLDLNLPGQDGLQVCQQIRQRSSVPILMLSARIEELDRLLGLELGADDYLCKPFSPREAVARVKALLRRADGRLGAPARQQLPGTGGFVIDEDGQRLWWHEQALSTTPVEFRLLRALLLAPGRVLSRATLLDSLHDDYRDVSDRAVDSHIKNLRRKLDALGLGPALQTVYGAGYCFRPIDASR